MRMKEHTIHNIRIRTCNLRPRVERVTAHVRRYGVMTREYAADGGRCFGGHGAPKFQHTL